METQNILVVDDNTTSRKVLRVTLEAAGRRVFEAGDGVEALTVLEREAVDAIISDILMPRMDGYRLCRELRRHKRHESTPFIFYASTYTSPGDEKLALGIGAQGFVRKPASAQDILRALESAAETPFAAPGAASLPEIDLLTDYNQRLVAKLEEKNVELEQRTQELEKAQNQLQHFVAKSPVVIYALHVEGQSISPAWVSENISALTGHDVQSVLQPDWWAQHLHPADRDRVLAKVPTIFQKGQCSDEYRLRRSDDSYVWIQDDRRWIRELPDQPEEILGSWVDVSERKRIEHQLLLQSTALEAAANAILVTDHQGLILWVNRAFTTLTGYLADEVRGKTPRVLKSGKHGPAFYADLWKTILSGATWRGEFINRRKDGSVFHSEHTITPIRSEDGVITHFVGILDDVTHRRKIEDELKVRAEALRLSEERFRELAENIDQVFWMTNPDRTRILYVSPAYERVWGRTCASLYVAPHSWLEAVHPEDRPRVLRAADPRQASTEFDHEFRILRPDGSVRWIRDRAFPVLNASGEVYRVTGLAEDITARKQAEQRLDAQHAITQALAESTTVNQAAGKILQVACQTLEWDLGELWTFDRAKNQSRCVEIWHPPSPEFSEFAAASRRMGVAPDEGVIGRVGSSGQPVWIADLAEEVDLPRKPLLTLLGLRTAVGFPVKLRAETLGVIQLFSARIHSPDDELVTMFAAAGSQIGQFLERKQLEEQFRQSQKMEAFGQLAGGVAHDFNNILGVIQGYVQLMMMDEQRSADDEQALQQILSSAERAASLTRQLLIVQPARGGAAQAGPTAGLHRRPG